MNVIPLIKRYTIIGVSCFFKYIYILTYNTILLFMIRNDLICAEHIIIETSDIDVISGIFLENDHHRDINKLIFNFCRLDGFVHHYLCSKLADWNLRQLVLSQCGLTDKMTHSLLDTLKNTRIETLDISKNPQITRQGLRHLGRLMETSSLQDLFLGYNSGLGDDGGVFVIELLPRGNIRNLDLKYCGIGMQTMRTFELLAKDCPTLKKLRLDGNKLNWTSLRMLTNGVLSSNQLSYVSLSGMLMTILCVREIVEMFPVLHTISLSACHIGYEELSIICKMLPLSKLRVLGLSQNDINNDGLKLLYETLQRSELRVLALNNIYISRIGLHYLSNMVKEGLICELFIIRCWLIDEIMDEFLDTLKQCDSLYKLDMRNNSLLHRIGFKLYDSVKNNIGLKCLRLDGTLIDERKQIEQRISINHSRQSKLMILLIHSQKLTVDLVHYLHEFL